MTASAHCLQQRPGSEALQGEQKMSYSAHHDTADSMNSCLQATEAALIAAAEAAGLRLRRADRKQEQALLQQHRAGLQQRLEAETEPAAVLSQAAPLLLAKVCRLLCQGLLPNLGCACVLPVGVSA